ncbi:MAG: hypothetical protein PHV10_07950 [Sulfuricurvum sp.]|nr:hypothetical protein [Sulfuricurvum sp.]
MIVLSDLPDVEAGLKALKNPEYRLFTKIEEMLGVLENVKGKSCVIIDHDIECSILPTIHLIKKLRGDLPLYVLSRRKECIAFVTDLLKAKVDDLFFYEEEVEILPLLQQIAKGVRHNISKNVAFIGCGTGATFTLLNTAVIMKKLYPNLKIGIVDCDYYKDDVLLRLDTQNRKPLTLNDLLIDSMEEQNCNYESLLSFNEIEEMLVVPSGGQSFYHSNVMGREDQHLKLLTSISMQNDITFFNIGTSLNDFTASALRLMDKSCIMVTQEPIPIQVLLNLSPLFKELSQNKDIDLVLNRYQKENRTITAEMIESVFGQKLTLKIPDSRFEVFASELERRPLHVSEGGDLVSALKELARKIVLDLAIPKEVL